LLDLGATDSSELGYPPIIKLCETHGIRVPYAALSHCWGKIPLVKTTKETRNTTRGIANLILPSLPKSFQDAAKVAMNLGLRYLWIDSLCIVQDDPLDWEEEAAKMGSIFESSYVAIAATSAIRSTVGFLSQREDPHEITGTNSDESQFSVFVRKRITKEDHEWLLLPYNARNGGKEVHPLLERG
jgi:hypothetical protein